MMIKHFLDFILELIKVYYANRYKHKTSSKTMDNNFNSIKQMNVFSMPLQSEFDLCKPLKKWGCYFFCIIFISIVVKRKKYDKVCHFDKKELVLLFKGFKDKNIAKKTAFVLNPNGLLEELGINHLIAFVDKKEEVKKYSENNFLITQYDYNDLTHFVVSDYKNKVIFDSLGNSLVRNKGKSTSVRRFEILDENLAKDINRSLSYIKV